MNLTLEYAIIILLCPRALALSYVFTSFWEAVDIHLGPAADSYRFMAARHKACTLSYRLQEDVNEQVFDQCNDFNLEKRVAFDLKHFNSGLAFHSRHFQSHWAPDLEFEFMDTLLRTLAVIRDLGRIYHWSAASPIFEQLARLDKQWTMGEPPAPAAWDQGAASHHGGGFFSPPPLPYMELQARKFDASHKPPNLPDVRDQGSLSAEQLRELKERSREVSLVLGVLVHEFTAQPVVWPTLPATASGGGGSSSYNGNNDEPNSGQSHANSRKPLAIQPLAAPRKMTMQRRREEVYYLGYPVYYDEDMMWVPRPDWLPVKETTRISLHW
ncbi:hypothetical protein BX600DRAFT_459781 [Xylariales sp. PMI_506]|nr:hypothetical protein BX600DRAFT_459781 [Xylariales sp. PMI_506]